MKFEQAVKERFERCTPRELREFCKQHNIKIGPNTAPDTMVRKLLEALDLSPNVHADTARDKVVRLRSRSEVIPPYNLTFEGTWEGRRRRIRLARPADAVKGDGAIEVSVNGKNPYPIPFNRVEAVPYPIYNRLNELRQVNRYQKTLDSGEVTTAFDFTDPKYNFADLGDDPDTADRARDLNDWYRAKGPTWLRERNIREMRMIANICQIDDRVKNDAGTGTRPMNEDELLQALMLAFYNEIDVEEIGEAAEA